MLHCVHGTPSPVGTVPPMPEEEEKNNHERDSPETRAHWSSGGRIWVLAAPPGVPDFAQTDEDQNERPVSPKNRPWIEGRMPVGVEENRANRDKKHGKNQGSAPGSAVLTHHTPLHTVVRTKEQKSSGMRKK